MRWITFAFCMIAVAMIAAGCLTPEQAHLVSGAGGAVSNSILPGSGSLVDALIYAGLGYIGLRGGEAGGKYLLDKRAEKSGG